MSLPVIQWIERNNSHNEHLLSKQRVPVINGFLFNKPSKRPNGEIFWHCIKYRGKHNLNCKATVNTLWDTIVCGRYTLADHNHPPEEIEKQLIRPNKKPERPRKKAKISEIINKQ